jgi:hypothetical protein
MEEKRLHQIGSLADEVSCEFPHRLREIEKPFRPEANDLDFRGP